MREVECIKEVPVEHRVVETVEVYIERPVERVEIVEIEVPKVIT